MQVGVILGYFYGKGLILCPNNTLRYFDLNDDIYYSIKNEIGWNFHRDKKNNVHLVWGIKEKFVALFDVCSKDKYKAEIKKCFNDVNEEMQNEAKIFYDYLSLKKPDNIETKIHYDIKRNTEYVDEFDLEKILDSYIVENYEESPTKKYWIGSIDTNDNYILSLVHPSNVNREERVEYLKGRDYEREEIIKSKVRASYSKSEHLQYLLENAIISNIKGFKSEFELYTEVTSTMKAQYPFDDVAWLINKTWPHMKPELLCKKYNEEYKNGGDYRNFGDKNNSRRRYLRNKEENYNRQYQRSSRSYSSWDPESYVMNTLMYGDAESLGF